MRLKHCRELLKLIAGDTALVYRCHPNSKNSQFARQIIFAYNLIMENNFAI